MLGRRGASAAKAISGMTSVPTMATRQGVTSPRLSFVLTARIERACAVPMSSLSCFHNDTPQTATAPQ